LRHQSSTGRGQAVEELFEQHSEKLFAYLRQRTPSREDTEDILVATFMAALAEAKFAHLPASGQVAGSGAWRATKSWMPFCGLASQRRRDCVESHHARVSAANEC